MTRTEQISFPPFRLDPVNEQLWCEHHLVPLRPRTFAVLRFLVEHAGRLVTKDELLKGVWPETRVSEGILKGYIRDLRDILGDNSQQPRFIETVPRRGHRFIAAVTTVAPVPSSEFQVPSPPPSPAPSPQSLAPLLVGRETELAQLARLFAKALAGERQMVFVTGEPGIGKTTLVEEFLFGVRSREKFGVQNSEPRTLNTELPSTLDPWIGRGQCVEQHGAGEAYLPVLEALGRIGRAPGGEQFVAILQQYAPTWLVQMPALLAAEELETVQRRVFGATRERMLREMVEAIEVLTAHRPLVLWFEDLHWTDASTVDWLAAVAQQGAPARLLVIGTYRPSDLSLSGHSLRAVKQELMAKGQCEELWLPFLSAEDVTHYLTRRYAQQQFPSGLGTAIHRRTDGNPLFVVNMVEYLVAQGVIAEVDGHWWLQTTVEEVGRGVPESLRQLIEKHIERLSEEQQRLLAVASVVGVTFSAAAVAAGAETLVEQVEEWCEGLVKRGQFLQAQEPRVLPDGTLCGRYGFQHALQQAVVYERIPSLRRLRLHRRVGEGEERLYGARAREIAAELAVHFERGGDLPRAVQYRQHAGHNTLRQHGYQEAISHLTKGLELLKTLPDTPECIQQELILQTTLGPALIAAKGQAAPDVGRAYARARELCSQLGETPQLFSVLLGLRRFYLVQAELQTARELGEQLLRLARNEQDSSLLLEAHCALGLPLFWLGELLSARAHLEQGIALYDPQRHSSHVFLYGQDPGVLCRVYGAFSLWHLGYPDQALQRTHEAIILAQDLSHPYSLAFALFTAAWVHQYRGEGPAAQERAERMMMLCDEHGFPFWLGEGMILRGWAVVEQGQKEDGLVHMRQGLSAYRAAGIELAQPYFLARLAEAYEKVGKGDEALAMLTEALAMVNNKGERMWEAELYRLKGQLTLARSSVQRLASSITNPQPPIPSPQSEAEACFLKAIEIAQRQQAKSLELRAVMSLVRLRQQQAAQHASRTTQHEARIKLDEAHRMLAEVYNWFTEGFDTKDLQDAKALLDALA